MTFTRNAIQPCAICGKGLMHANPTGIFWRISAERLIIDQRAVQREHGLEMMMGGNAAIAAALSPERTFAQSFGETQRFLVCEPCALTCCGELPKALFPEETP